MENLKDVEFLIVSRKDSEWEKMWDKIGTKTDKEQECNGEIWQYLGTIKSGDTVMFHEFRHRCHPTTGERTYRRIAVSEKFAKRHINKTVKVTFTNDFHNKSTYVRAELLGGEAFITWKQHKNALKRLCGIKDCTCESNVPDITSTCVEGFCTTIKERM